MRQLGDILKHLSREELEAEVASLRLALEAARLEAKTARPGRDDFPRNDAASAAPSTDPRTISPTVPVPVSLPCASWSTKSLLASHLASASRSWITPPSNVIPSPVKVMGGCDVDELGPGQKRTPESATGVAERLLRPGTHDGSSDG